MEPNITRRRALVSTGALVTVGTFAGCGGDGGNGGNGGNGNGGDDNVVDMTDGNVFEPDELTVSAGDTVGWENTSNVGHTVTAYGDEIPDGAEYFASGGFDSEQAARDGYADGLQGNIEGGESYEHTFETPGSYGYFCIPHEGTMTGTIVVEE